MIKILFFITSLAGGGAEKVLVNMVNHLDCDKYDITVQTLFDEGVNKKSLSKHIKYISVFRKSFRGNIYLFKLFSPKFLYKRFIKNDYDIIVSYFQGATTRIVAGCPNRNVKKVQWIHNEFHEQKKIARCYRSINECIKLQRNFDATVSVANTVQEIYLSTFPNIIRNPIVLYNVVESDIIVSKSKEIITDVNIDSSYINLISVGRMVLQKSFDRLIRIIGKLIRDDDFRIKLYLLGNGELLEHMKKLAVEEDLQNNVFFLGYNENPYKYVRAADLFVCSSLHEGFSTAVTEALIVGTPVITTECSGMRELLGENQEYGIITDNNEEALYTALKRVLNNKQQLDELKKAALKRGKDFNCESRVKCIEKFFDSL